MNVTMPKPRFSGFYVLEKYTQAQIHKECRGWVSRNQTPERDQIFFAEAKRDFTSPVMQGLRDIRALQIKYLAPALEAVRQKIAAETLGDSFGQVCQNACHDKDARADRDSRMDAYSTAMGKVFPFTPPSSEQYLANTASPQLTYILLPGDKAMVFTGSDAIHADWALGVDPSSVNRGNPNANVSPQFTYREGLRVNYDFRYYDQGAIDYFKRRLGDKPELADIKPQLNEV